MHRKKKILLLKKEMMIFRRVVSFNYFYHVLIIYVAISFSKVKPNVSNNLIYIHFHTILNTTYS